MFFSCELYYKPYGVVRYQPGNFLFNDGILKAFVSKESNTNSFNSETFCRSF